MRIQLTSLFVAFAAFCSTPQAPAQTVNLAVPRTATATVTENLELFRAGEAQIDLLGTGRIEDLTNLSETKKGAGVALNYFPWRSAGFGIEGRGEGRGLLVDNSAAFLIGRFPLESLRLAPEIKLGADYAWKERDWAVLAAVGLDYRFTRNIGAALEVRGVRPIAGAQGEHVAVLAKLRVAL